MLPLDASKIDDYKRALSLKLKGHEVTKEARQKMREAAKSRPSNRKGTSKYPGIDLNQVIYCKCGCGEKIKIKEHHKYQGIPKYIWGHNPPPNKNTYGLQTAWNKGLTKEMDDRVRKMGRKGRKASEETKHRQKEAWLYREWGGRRKEEARQKLKIKGIENWKNPVYREKQIKAIYKGHKVKPNKPELQLQAILQELYPNEFKYVGDGDVIIAGKFPDFININGKKQIIELYGDYWHRNDNPEDRIKVFEPYGYKTRIIWERELKNVDKVKDRIRNFVL